MPCRGLSPACLTENITYKFLIYNKKTPGFPGDPAFSDH